MERYRSTSYLGSMTMDYTKKGKVKITMMSYIKGMHDELLPAMASKSAALTANHLFQVNEDAENLSKKDAQFFHHNVAKLLFLCKRARPNIQTAITFLCTRVKCPDADDYNKLTQTMWYL